MSSVKIESLHASVSNFPCGNESTEKKQSAKASHTNSVRENSQTVKKLHYLTRRHGLPRRHRCDYTPIEKDQAAASIDSFRLENDSQTGTCYIERDICKKLAPIKLIEGSNTWKLEVFQITFDTKDDLGNFRAVLINQDGVRVTRTSASFMKLILLLLTENNDAKAPSNAGVATNCVMKKDASTNTSINDIIKQPFSKPIPIIKTRKRLKNKMSPFFLTANEKIVIKRTIIDPFDRSFDYLDNCKEDTNDSETTMVPNETITQDFDPGNDQIDPLGEFQDTDDVQSMGSMGTLTQSVINLNENEIHEVVKRFTSEQSITDLVEPVNNRGIKRASYVPGPNKRLHVDMTDVSTNTSQSTVHSHQVQTQEEMQLPSNLNQNNLQSHQIGTSYLEVQSQMRNLREKCPMVPQIQMPSLKFLQQILSSMSTAQSEEWFNLLSAERLKMMSKKDAEQLKRLQMYIDYKFCTESDEYGYLPIHNAIMRDDVHLLKRQCFVLRGNGISPDIGDKNENKSPLQLCIANSGDIELVRVLLKMGASPLYVDATGQSAVHCAAEHPSPEYMHLLLQHLKDNHCDTDSDATGSSLVEYPSGQGDAALCHAALMLDNSGYTPLMLAAKQGNADHVTLLLEDIVDSRRVANARSPNSGNTALYLAVEAACCEAKDRRNMSKVPDNYARTIESLIRYGADHEIQNDYNSNVSTIVNECVFSALNTLVSKCLEKNKMRSERVTLAMQDSVRAVERTMGINQPFIIVKNGDQLHCLDKNGKKFGDASRLRAVRIVSTTSQKKVKDRDESARELPVISTNAASDHSAVEDNAILKTESSPPLMIVENGDKRIGMEYSYKKVRECASNQFVNPDVGKYAPVEEQGKINTDPPVNNTDANENTNSTPISVEIKSILSMPDEKNGNAVKVKFFPASQMNASTYTNTTVTKKRILIENPSRKGKIVIPSKNLKLLQSRNKTRFLPNDDFRVQQPIKDVDVAVPEQNFEHQQEVNEVQNGAKVSSTECYTC